MKKQIIVTLVVSCFLSWVLPGCSILEEPGEGSDVLKRRGVGTGGGVDWTGIQAQDLAILLPREPDGAINAKTKTASGRNFLPLHWVESVGDAFVDTDAGTALEEENRYAEWELVSIRVAPYSPLGHRPGAEAERICLPEVRLVWQPNQYDFHIGWTRVAEFSDDRAIHALYRA